MPLVVVFNLVPRFLDATIRQFGFLLKGLREVEADLREKHIPFHLLSGAAVMLDVYGTCKLAEKPANPMLLESVGQQGCTELTAPIAGHVEIRPVDRVEL